VIAGWRPDDAPGPLQPETTISGEESVTVTRGTGLFEVSLQTKHVISEPFTLAIRSTAQSRPKPSSDDRELVFILTELKALHPKKRFSFFG
jgi:hypothetical protein